MDHEKGRARSVLARVAARIAHGPAHECAYEDALREANARFERAFEDAPIGMALVGLDGRWLQVNEALCHLTGYERDELLEKTFQDITHPDDLEADVELAARVVAGELATYQMEKRYIRADGDIVWILLSVSMVHGAAGEPLYFISQILDITERKQAEAELRRLADHDHLTGLFNRRRFQEELERQIAYVERYARGCAVLVLDLDHLKHVNDTLGHQAGDELIVAVAELLRDVLRETDILGRLGGDEFAVLLPEATAEQAAVVADKVVTAIREGAVLIGGEAVSTTASLGVAAYVPGDGVDAGELLVSADVAMYRAKERGGDRWAQVDVSRSASSTSMRTPNPDAPLPT